MTKILRTLLVAGGLCVWSGSLWASLMASTSIDFGSLQVRVVDTDPNDGIDASIQWNGSWSWANACVDVPGDGNCDGSAYPNSFNPFSYLGPVSAAADFGGIHGYSVVDGLSQYAEISGNTLSGQRSVNAARMASFTFIGAGRIELSLDYTLTAGAQGEDWTHESLAFAGIMLWEQDGHLIEANDLLVRPFDGVETRTGTLFNTLDGLDGDTTSFLLHAHTHLKSYASDVTDVPEPGSLALSAAALCALGRFGRRRLRK